MKINKAIKSIKVIKKKINNITQKNKLDNKLMELCPIGLKPFEKKFSVKPMEEKNSKMKKEHTKTMKEFSKELLSKFAPNSIKPENDFYDYINFQWLKEVSVKKQQDYLTQIDDFRLTQDKVYHELNDIILDYIKTHNDKLSKNLKNYYTSVINMNPKSYSRQLGKEAEQLITDYTSGNNPWELLAQINRDEMIKDASPFVWSLNPDLKNVKQYRCYVDPHHFAILDLSVYYDDGTQVEYKKKYRNAFKTTCKKLFDTILGPNDYNPEDVFSVEQEIFNTLGCADVTKKTESFYNKVTADEAMSKYGFDWKEFSTHLGFKTPPRFFITSSLNYLKCGSELLVKNWKTPKWKTYWVWIFLMKLARITKNWEKITYEFYGNFERGQTGINASDAVSASLYMSVPFNTFLTNQYVIKYYNTQRIKFVETLCNDLKIVFKKILLRNTWLEPSTKKYALKKLQHFKFVYGVPENLREDPDLDYTEILYDNMQKINDWRHLRFIELEGKEPIDIPVMDWTQYPVKMTGTQAYIVNASYTPSKNSIYINLGYIQKPFVDLDERGIEYNLAHVGFTIGHEMSHGFDDSGSQYGLDGNLYDWWTPKDKKKFKEIQKDVIKQYEEFAARDGIKFDASIGIGEDLADISGLAICDEYLRDFQENNKDLMPIRYLAYEVFYVYYAFQQRQKVAKKALAAQLKTNPHPLDKYRCNVPLSRSIVFRSLYDVKKGDGMWWKNEDTVWN
jgi:putative endopeptidase